MKTAPRHTLRAILRLPVLICCLLVPSIHPVLAADVSGYALVTNQLDNSVSVISIPDGTLHHTIHNIPKPAPIAICNAAAIVTSADDHKLTLIDLATYKTQELDLGAGPFGVDCEATKAYIGDWFANQVYVLSLESHQIEKRIDVGRSPTGVLVNKADNHLYVANRDDDTVSVLDLDTYLVVATLETGDAPYGLAYNASKNHLYVINVRSNDVTVIDTNTLTVTDSWEVGEWPYCGAVSLDGKYLYVTNQEDATLSVLDTENGMILDTLPISEVPEGVDITQDQRYIVSVGWESGVIDIIDRAKLTIIRQIAAGKGSRSFGRFITPSKKPY